MAAEVGQVLDALIGSRCVMRRSARRPTRRGRAAARAAEPRRATRGGVVRRRDDDGPTRAAGSARGGRGQRAAERAAKDALGTRSRHAVEGLGDEGEGGPPPPRGAKPQGVGEGASGGRSGGAAAAVAGDVEVLVAAGAAVLVLLVLLVLLVFLVRNDGGGALREMQALCLQHILVNTDIACLSLPQSGGAAGGGGAALRPPPDDVDLAAPLRWRCRAGHVFTGRLKQMETWLSRARRCPMCEALTCAHQVATLRGTTCVGLHFCAGGETLRAELKPYASSYARYYTQATFDRPEARPATPTSPLMEGDATGQRSQGGVLAVKWRCGVGTLGDV